jgi:hypothetical protein
VKPAAGYRPLAYSSPEPVQTPGTVALGLAAALQSIINHCEDDDPKIALFELHTLAFRRVPRVDRWLDEGGADG